MRVWKYRMAWSLAVVALKGKFKIWEETVGRAGFKALLLVRLSPVGPPFDAISYVAGLVGISFWSHFVATLVGILPAVIVYSFRGDSLTGGAIAILAGVFLVALISLLLPWYLRRR